MNKIYLYGLFFLLILSSCQNTRYILKKNHIPEINIDSYSPVHTLYKLQPYDYLYIDIKSTNEEINKLYAQISSPSSQPNSGDATSSFLSGYLINDSGYVSIPTIGNVFVHGLTIDETRKLIQQKIDDVLNDAIVNVRLNSFNVTFLGEINNSGQISFYREKVNILEAIGKAGGLSNYADLKRIKILRPKDSLLQVYSLDITNVNIIEQKEFYIYPNDIIYIPPKRSKEIVGFFRDYSTVVTVFTSTITTTLLISQLYKNNGQ